MRYLRCKHIAGLLLCFFVVFSSAAFCIAEDNAFDKAGKAYAKKDFKTAARYFMEHLEKKPDPHAYYLLGYSLYKLKRYSEAIEYFQKAYFLDPELSPVLLK
jgi:tetratricopeptide (TPR) repeat protein